MVEDTLNAPYSHYALSAELSQEIDRRTINEMEIEGFTLMEVAGSSAAKIILREFTDLHHGIYLCGKGNNGGDALVVARYLMQEGIDATIVFISGTADLSADAEKNYKLLKNYSSSASLDINDGWDAFDPQAEFDFIVDGMLGTGLDSDVRGDYATAVEWVNNQESIVFAMDIPTGIHPDTGQAMGCAINATRTFAFGSRKQGFYLAAGPDFTGTINYCELPFPNQYKDTCQTFVLDESWIPMRAAKPGRHKYDAGLLYIIAGSEGLTGAAIMAAQSAWAEGIGAVMLICPRGVLPIYEQNLPPIIKKPVGNREDYHFSADHAREVLDIIAEKEGKVLLGPGLGREDTTVAFVENVLSKNTSDTVIDADGLWCLAQIKEWNKPDQTEWILTPHPGELQQFIDDDVFKASNRLNAVRNFASSNGITVLSKGMPGIVAGSDENCFLTNYNTRYFSRAGNGDVLSGKVGAHLALGKSPALSCATGLLRGKQKLEIYLRNNTGLPEPRDFI